MHMSSIADNLPTDGKPLNLSRSRFLGGSMGALVLGVLLPSEVLRAAQSAVAEIKPGTRIPAFLEIRPDGTALLRCPFVEGGQGIYTAFAQIVGEELDIAPKRFSVECAPPGADYLMVSGNRFTGGSFSVRSSYDVMRRLGASARHMLLQVAAAKLNVPVESLTTQPGIVLHSASGRSLGYGELAAVAAALPAPENVSLRAKEDFRWIGKSVPRLDAHDKATGRVQYNIDTQVEGMLLAAVQHAPRMGGEPGAIANEAEVKAMPGVHSIHRLPGAVAVVAQRWWQARRAVESLKVSWSEAAPGTPHAMPADFSSAGMRDALAAKPGPGVAAEDIGDTAKALENASQVIEATYDAPYLAHGQLEPPSAIARWNADGTLELWLPNQAPELFQQSAAKAAGMAPEKVIIHSPPLGGFFGRHFLYGTANPFPQAIQLAKAVGRPVKLIWSREEEFLRDAFRPMGLARLRAGIDANGLPIALHAEAVGESPTERWFGHQPDKANGAAVEGIADKHYAIPNRRVTQVYMEHPPTIGFWRSVGHSMNDFSTSRFSMKWPMPANKTPTSCACACWRTNHGTKPCCKQSLSSRVAGNAVPLPRATAASARVGWPWRHPLAARWPPSPRCLSRAALSWCMTSGWPSIRAVSSTLRLSRRKWLPPWPWVCPPRCWKRSCTRAACPKRATSVPTPSCRLTACHPRMCALSKAAHPWAALANPVYRASRQRWSMRWRHSLGSACAACRFPRRALPTSDA